jgi:cell wall-associated NlpC family hydrolase
MTKITLDQFANKYNGKYVDWDQQYGPQCVDLMRFYLKEVLGYPSESIPSAITAKKIFLNFSSNNYFTKIVSPYGDPQMPKKGDIVFWGFWLGVTGLAGHVAICIGAGEYQFISFDQNYGKPNFCRFTNHSYKGVMGWLTPKK